MKTLFYKLLLISTICSLFQTCKEKEPVPAPIANFDVNPLTISFTVPTTVKFSNLSTNADSYFWTYPGGSSTEKDLVLAVTTAGSYTITLKATGSGGTDTKSKVFTFIAPIINTPPVASFTYSPNQNLIAPTKITFTNTSQNADSYQWDFGDGTTSTEVNPLKEFSKSGTFNVKLIAFSKTAFAESRSEILVNMPVITVTTLPSIDKAITDLMTKYNLPGVSIALVKDDKLVYAKGYGFADKTNNISVRTDHLFRIASLSKSITGVAIFKLVEQGKISLDAIVFGKNGVLGTDYGTQPYGAGIESITVRHLLQHIAGGWGNSVDDPMFESAWSSYSQSLLISTVLNTRPLNNPPGSKYDYSNFGYLILGRIIEKVTGQTYRSYVQETILKPFGITTMEIGGDTESERLPNEVKYYDTNYSPYLMKIKRMDAHGGWVASAVDLARILVRVNGFANKPDILTSSSISQMITPSKANLNYACGWQVNNVNNWWHTGSLPGESAEWIRTNGNMGWVILVNQRSNDSNYFNDLDATFWKGISGITQWPNQDLF